MRRLFLSLLVLVGVLGASAASAGTLTAVTWTQTAQGFPLTRTTADLPGSNGTSTATSISVFINYPFTSTNFFVPKTPNGTLDLAIQVTQGGSQNITAMASTAAATQGIPGTVVVMTAAHFAGGLMQSMFMVGINTLVQVPLSAGVANLFTGTFTVVGALHTITVQFYSWTPHTLMFSGLTSAGPAANPGGATTMQQLPNVTAMGSFNLTAGGGGTVTLVSPSKVDIDGSLAQRRTAGFTAVTLHFVPEPGTLLLLGAGALGLVLMGSRKR